MAAANIITVTDASFDQDVIKSPTPVLVDFWAEWCGPCKMLGPLLDELAAEYDGKVRIAKVNIDDHRSLAAKFRINTIPTLLFFKNGEVVDQVVGMKGKKEFKAKLDQFSA